MYDIAKELNFDVGGQGRKSIRGRTLLYLLESPAIMASGNLDTKFLPSDSDHLCDRLNLLLQEKQAGDNSDVINEEIITIVDDLLEYKCTFKKQHKQILLKCNLLHKV